MNWWQPLRDALQHAWSADTAYKRSDYTPQSPKGQCVPTALVVHELLGGDVMRCDIAGERHYYNLMPDGVVIDLTRDQYPPDAVYENVKKAEPERMKRTQRSGPRFRVLLHALEAE